MEKLTVQLDKQSSCRVYWNRKLLFGLQMTAPRAKARVSPFVQVKSFVVITTLSQPFR